MLGIATVRISRPHNPGAVLRAVRRHGQHCPALPARSGRGEIDLARPIQQVGRAVERDRAQEIVLGPHVHEGLRAALIVRRLAMHVGAGAERDDLLHLIARADAAHVVLVQEIEVPVLAARQEIIRAGNEQRSHRPVIEVVVVERLVIGGGEEARDL